MLFKIFTFIVLAMIISSLYTAWKHIAKGEGNSEKAVKALTWRISLSLFLFFALVLGLYFGWIQR